MNSRIALTLCLALFFASPAACQGQKASSGSNPPPTATPSAEKAPAPSAPPASAPATPASKPSGENVDATKWIEGMASVLPNIFCKEGSYFRECFKVSAQECETEAIRVTRVCLQSKEADIRATLDKEGGKKWGEKVGECAGESYELSFKDKRNDSPKCNDPTKWM